MGNGRWHSASDVLPGGSRRRSPLPLAPFPLPICHFPFPISHPRRRRGRGRGAENPAAGREVIAEAPRRESGEPVENASNLADSAAAPGGTLLAFVAAGPCDSLISTMHSAVVPWLTVPAVAQTFVAP